MTRGATRRALLSLLLAVGLGACDRGEDRGDLLEAGEPPRYSQSNEEVIIRDFFQDERDGFFVDIGCAWPVRNSTTYYLEKHLGWSGIGVDAVAAYGPRWLDKRPNAKFLHYAITNRSGGTIRFFQHDWPGVSSLSEEQASGFGGPERLEEVAVPAITLDDLLDAQGVDRIDHLTIDIEGAELQALEGFDIERFRPRLVCVEAHTNGEPGEQALLRYFGEHGYARIDHYLAYELANWYFRPASQ